MTEAILVSLAIVVGLDWRVVAILTGSVLFPFVALGAFAMHAVRSRSGTNTRSAVFCQSVARGLRVGSSLRSAIGDAAIVVGENELAAMVESGCRWDDALPSFHRSFPEVGSELAVLIASVAESGADSSALFEEVGDLALAQVEAEEEVRVATASARASAMVLIGLPVIFVGYQIRSGNLATLLSQPGSGLMAGAGLTVMSLGIVISIVMVRRSR